MDKKWVDEKIKEQEEQRKEICDRIMKAVAEADNIEEEDKKKIKNCLKKKKYVSAYSRIQIAVITYHMLHDGMKMDAEAIKRETKYFNDLGADRIKDWNDYDHEDIEELLDSEVKSFSGDIIITDPCYLLRPQSQDDDWKKCNHGFAMENLGFKNCMVRDTIYGDWSCTTYNDDTKEPIGSFCADAGEVGVFLLDEVMQYNPDFDYHINRPWTTTLIKDFEGTVQFIVVNVGDEDGDYFDVRVVGKGKNKVTGEPINFITSQTEL